MQCSAHCTFRGKDGSSGLDAGAKKSCFARCASSIHACHCTLSKCTLLRPCSYTYDLCNLSTIRNVICAATPPEMLPRFMKSCYVTHIFFSQAMERQCAVKCVDIASCVLLKCQHICCFRSLVSVSVLLSALIFSQAACLRSAASVSLGALLRTLLFCSSCVSVMCQPRFACMLQHRGAYFYLISYVKYRVRGLRNNVEYNT